MSKNEGSEIDKNNGQYSTGPDGAPGERTVCHNCAQAPADAIEALLGPVILLELPVVVPESSPEGSSDKPGALYEAIRRRMAALEVQNGERLLAVRTSVDRLRTLMQNVDSSVRFLRTAAPALTCEKLQDGLEEICCRVQELEAALDQWLQQQSARSNDAGTLTQE